MGKFSHAEWTEITTSCELGSHYSVLPSYTWLVLKEKHLSSIFFSHHWTVWLWYYLFLSVFICNHIPPFFPRNILPIICLKWNNKTALQWFVENWAHNIPYRHMALDSATPCLLPRRAAFFFFLLNLFGTLSCIRCTLLVKRGRL